MKMKRYQYKDRSFYSEGEFVQWALRNLKLDYIDPDLAGKKVRVKHAIYSACSFPQKLILGEVGSLVDGTLSRGYYNVHFNTEQYEGNAYLAPEEIEFLED
jgi:hypothetical protein